MGNARANETPERPKAQTSVEARHQQAPPFQDLEIYGASGQRPAEVAVQAGRYPWAPNTSSGLGLGKHVGAPEDDVSKYPQSAPLVEQSSLSGVVGERLMEQMAQGLRVPPRDSVPALPVPNGRDG